MANKTALTDYLVQRFSAKMGDSASIDNFAIYKVKAISTERLSKPYSLYDNAECTPSTVFSLSNIVANTDTNVGVVYNHDTMMLNVGRAFHAEFSQEENGKAVAYVYLAIMKTSETVDLIKKIDNSVLDEVSVNFKATHIKCSECGWDYNGEDADESNWWEMTCANGHKVGIDGCHVVLDGVDLFFEISIVNQGAAKNPKILNSYTKENMVKNEGYQMAASNKPSYMYVTRLNTRLENTMEELENKEPAKEETVPAEPAKEETVPAEPAKEETVPTEPAKEETVPAEPAKEETVPAEPAPQVDEEKEELKAALARVEAEKNELAEKLKVADDEKTQVLSAYRSEVKKVMVALNKTEIEIPESLDGISKLLEDSKATLLSAIPVGGVSQEVKPKTKDHEVIVNGLTKAQLSAFQVKTNK